MDLRGEDGSHYKVNSLESIRHGLNRYLKSPPFNKKIDIVKDSSFADGKYVFQGCACRSKKDGEGRRAAPPYHHDHLRC